MRIKNLFLSFSISVLLGISHSAFAQELVTEVDCFDCQALQQNNKKMVEVTPPVVVEGALAAEKTATPKASAPTTGKSNISKATTKKVIVKSTPAAKTTSVESVASKMREGFYVEVKGGIDKPRHLKQDFSKFTIDKSPMFEARGGYNYKHFAIDLTVSHSPKNKVHLDDANEDGDKFKHRYKVKYTAVMLSAYYNVLHYKGITPYIGLGAGISRNTINNYKVYSDFDLVTSTSNPGTFVDYKKRKGATASNFAWQAIVGARVQIAKDWELSAEYKYMNLGKIKTAGGEYITPIGPGPDKVEKSNLRVNAFLAGIRYYF